MTTTALIVIVIVVGLVANAVLIYVALRRLHDAREIGHSRRPAARARDDAAAGGPVGSIHREWHRPGEPAAALAASPRIARARPGPEPEPVSPVEAGSAADEDRSLAEAIADFVRSAHVITRSAEHSATPGDDAGIAPGSPVGPASEGARGGRASVVVVDVQAGSGRIGLGQPRDIDLSVARALRRTARDADEVRRLGHASFAVVLAGTRGPGADAFVGRARKALAEVLAPYRGSTFSIAAEDVADDPDEALQRALQSLDAKGDEHPRRGRPVSP